MAMRFIFSQNIINARDRIIQDLSLGLEDAEFNFDTFVFDMVDQCLLMFLEDLQLEMESHPVTNAEKIQTTVQDLIDHHRRDMTST